MVHQGNMRGCRCWIVLRVAGDRAAGVVDAASVLEGVAVRLCEYSWFQAGVPAAVASCCALVCCCHSRRSMPQSRLRHDAAGARCFHLVSRGRHHATEQLGMMHCCSRPGIMHGCCCTPDVKQYIH